MRKIHVFLIIIAFFGCDNKKEVSLQTISNSQITQNKGEITSIKGGFEVSGIYPHLTTYTHGRVSEKEIDNGRTQWECGIGALASWNDKLYMINYGAHEPKGSEHKLYIVDKDLKMEIFEGSVGGTPACRMVHKESNQLFIGHYVINSNDEIRVIDIKKMPGRLTAVARHLKDPENYVYYYDMEGMLYEVNVHTLEPKLLYKKPLPGWHGKGGYTSQGKLILTNNGTRSTPDPIEHWKVDTVGVYGKEKYGVLAEYDGENFNIVERRQYTDVTTKNGINAVANEQSPLWSMGWDKRSVRLSVMDKGGVWKTFLIPKATYNNDPSHGWFTEWPRIREVQPGKFMMDMHGMFYDFPSTFSHDQTAGIQPMGSHLRYIPDFIYWNDKVVLATDELSIQGNPLAGQPQSNLWFGSVEELSNWGPASGYGSIWLEDDVVANKPSLPYLFQGFDERILHLTNFEEKPTNILIELDKDGTGNWELYKTIALKEKEYQYVLFDSNLKASWVRLTSNQNAKLTGTFHYTDASLERDSNEKSVFEGIASHDYKEKVLDSKLYANKENFDLTLFSGTIGKVNFTADQVYQLDKYNLSFSKKAVDSSASKALKNQVIWEEDKASVILNFEKQRLRLPKGKGTYHPLTTRSVREVQSERILANIHGTFYEVPLYKVGKEPLYNMIRPVATHNRKITDYTTWNGMLVLNGVTEEAIATKHVLKNVDNKAAVWVGGIDDLWSFGKPTGEGGVWKDSDVKKDIVSDKYLMTGYDQKEVRLKADKDVTISLLVYNTHYSDEASVYKTFDLKAGEEVLHKFPKGFSSHWIAAKASQDCKATAWFVYK